MFQMHVLHFQLGVNHSREMLTLNIRTQDFFYRGPTCVIHPTELAVCLPCANNSHEHMDPAGDACELATMQGWMPPSRLQSVAAFVLDNQSEKYLVLENGQSLFRTLVVGLKHKAVYTKCRVSPHNCLQYTNETHPDDVELMDYLDINDMNDYDQNDDDEDTDEGIYGDMSTDMVYIALEHIDLEQVSDLD
jgi:hypothetical protein